MDMFGIFKTNPKVDYLVAQLKQPSSWRGLTMLLTAFGVALSPEQAAAITSAGMAIAGAIGLFAPDQIEP
jgi:hypothetical protein